MAAILPSRAVRTALATVSVAVAVVAGATTAAAAPLPLEQPAVAPQAAPALVSTTTGSFDSGEDFVGSVALAITDIIKDPTWLLLPVIIGVCALTAGSAGVPCDPWP